MMPGDRPQEQQRKRSSRLLDLLLLLILLIVLPLSLWLVGLLSISSQMGNVVKGLIEAQLQQIAEVTTPQETPSPQTAAMPAPGGRPGPSSGIIPRPEGNIAPAAQPYNPFSLLSISKFILDRLSRYFGARYAVLTILGKLSDTRPIVLPVANVSMQQFTLLQNRIAAFNEAISRGETSRPLELNAEDINALIAHSPELRDWRRHLLVRIRGDQITTEMSVPLYYFAPSDPQFEGHYLNCVVSVKMDFYDGHFEAFPQSIQIKGRTAPDALMRRISKINFAKDINKTAGKLSRLNRIEVKNGKVVVTAKPGKTPGGDSQHP